MRAYPRGPETDERGELVPPSRRPPTAIGLFSDDPPPPPPSSSNAPPSPGDEEDPHPNGNPGWLARHPILATCIVVVAASWQFLPSDASLGRLLLMLLPVAASFVDRKLSDELYGKRERRSAPPVLSWATVNRHLHAVVLLFLAANYAGFYLAPILLFWEAVVLLLVATVAIAKTLSRDPDGIPAGLEARPPELSPARQRRSAALAAAVEVEKAERRLKVVTARPFRRMSIDQLLDLRNRLEAELRRRAEER